TSLGIRAGTLGGGVDLSYALSQRAAVRLNADGYNRTQSKTHDNIDYDMKLKLQTGSLLGDWFPFANNFRISAGAMLNRNKFSMKGLPTGGSFTINGTPYAAALAPLTKRLELMTAVRPNFRLPALVAKEAATIDHISSGRFTLNVVSAWWQVESDMYGGSWVQHDERYARTEEFLAVLKGMWTKDEYSLEGRYYTIKNARLAPKPVQKPWPVLYAGGESP